VKKLKVRQKGDRGKIWSFGMGIKVGSGRLDRATVRRGLKKRCAPLPRVFKGSGVYVEEHRHGASAMARSVGVKGGAIPDTRWEAQLVGDLQVFFQREDVRKSSQARSDARENGLG